MKRSRSEVINNVLNSYLKRRQYAEFDVYHKDNGSVCSPDQMAVSAAVDRVVRRSNSFTFSLINNDMVAVDQQFLKLKTWIADLKQEKFQCELASLLCPVFCHLYLEMLCGGHRQSANKFFKRHQVLFSSREHNRELLEELSSVTSSQDIDSNSVVKAFRSCKYHVQLSQQAMTSLQKYLSNHGHIILLHLLNTWFDLEVDGIFKNDESEEPTNDVPIEEKDQVEGVDSVIQEMSLIKEYIYKAYNYANAPSMILYTINNCEEIVSCGRFSPKFDKVAVGMGSSVRLWGLTNKEMVVPPKTHINLAKRNYITEEDECETVTDNNVCLFGHYQRVQDLCFVSENNSDKYLLSVSLDTTMRCWRMEDNTCACIYRGHNRPVWCVTVDSMGLYAVTGSSDNTAKFWSLDRTYPLKSFIGHTEDVECVTFHPNSKYIATGSTDKTLRMWSVCDAKLVRFLVGHRGAVQTLSFSPNGLYLASSGEDKRIKIWDLRTAKVLNEFKGHNSTVVNLSWSKDSKNLASCSLDRSVRQWQLNQVNVNKVEDTPQGEDNSTLVANGHDTHSFSSTACNEIASFHADNSVLSVEHINNDIMIAVNAKYV